jgi:hypothetical protein
MEDPQRWLYYVINYKNEERKKNMLGQFSHFSIVPRFTDPVENDDPRLKDATNECRRVWAVMFQHLDSIRHFYEQTQETFCIVCEDDIRLSRTFLEDLKKLIPAIQEHVFDVVMLGYLLPYKIDMSTCLHKQYFQVIDHCDRFIFHEYPTDIWGTQMYLVTRSYAKHLLDKYTVDYALQHDTNNFSSDWIITKDGKRALIEPMIAVEEGRNLSDNGDQIDYHKRCYETNYDPSLYL